MTEIKKLLRSWLPTLLVALVLSLLVRTYIAEARWIPSESMLPTLEVGDQLFIDKAYFKFAGIQRGDILVFEAPAALDKDDDLIKRVIGLPGEELSIKDGIVYINGTPLKEPYIREKPDRDFEPFVIPEDQIFVMGDNRNNSYDSRYWGALPIKNVIGKAIFRHYPLGHMKLF